MHSDRETETPEWFADFERRLQSMERSIERRLQPTRPKAGLLAGFRGLNPWLRTAVAMTALAVPLVAYASSVSVPFAFTNGTIADADQVNANFVALETGVNDNDARIASLEATGADITSVLAGSGLAGGGTSGSVVVAVDPGQVQTRVASSCPAGSSIRVINVDGSVGCQTDTVGSGDITDVTAGTGLVGGGTAGSVTLGVAPSGITGDRIADGTITGADISPYLALLDVEVLGSTLLTGGLDIGSGPSDVRIFDDSNTFVWYSADGTAQHAGYLVDSQTVAFFDLNRFRSVFSSTVDGIGIGDVSPQPGFDVAVPSLYVGGDIDLGLTYVQTSYLLDVSLTSCPGLGNLPCYFGATFAACPVGTKVLGGGNELPAPAVGNLELSAPASAGGSWYCASSNQYSIAAYCYAICARAS